ncbi:hypothetical protein MMC22_008805 [Lobaria immixta]|nr:hypothetical protein [Lobaria immixta]
MSLTSLPPELLSYVVANVTSGYTLCSLARCLHQLYLCTIPHLYRHVKICEDGEPQIGPLRTLASLLIARPDLAGLVRQFTLRVSKGGTGWPYESEKREESEELEESEEYEDSDKVKEVEEDISPEIVKVDQAFATPFNSWSLSKEQKINCLAQFNDTHNSYYDLVLALLLPALLNVEKLVLDLNSSFDTDYLEQMMRRAACREKPFDTQLPFEALRVFVHSYERCSLRSTSFLASLLKLPAIQEISGAFKYSLDVEDNNHSEFRPPHKVLTDLDSSSSSLTSLNLSVYTLGISNLGHILRAPKALKTLIYKICAPICLNLTDIRHALRPQENFLESLDLDYDKHCFKTPAIFLLKTTNGTRRHSLIDIFPPSLATLHLTRFGVGFDPVLEALEHLLEEKSPQQIPLLEKLILEGTDTFDGSLDARFGVRSARLMYTVWMKKFEAVKGSLDRIAAAQGISIDVIAEPSVCGTDNENSLAGGSDSDESVERVLIWD